MINVCWQGVCVCVLCVRVCVCLNFPWKAVCACLCLCACYNGCLCVCICVCICLWYSCVCVSESECGCQFVHGCIFVSVCVCVCLCTCVNSSSAHLTPPGWSLCFALEGNCVAQFWILHFTNINHTWHSTDKPFYSRRVSVIRFTWYKLIFGQVMCQFASQRH